MDPVLALLLLAAALAAAYAAACRYWPYTACRRCDGGRRRSPTGRNWRPCPTCSGSGRRVRLGRRLFTAGRARSGR